MEKRIIPKFETEVEEANWWFENQDELDKDFAQAFAENSLQRRTVPRLGNTQPPDDVSLCRERLR